MQPGQGPSSNQRRILREARNGLQKGARSRWIPLSAALFLSAAGCGNESNTDDGSSETGGTFASTGGGPFGSGGSSAGGLGQIGGSGVVVGAGGIPVGSGGVVIGNGGVVGAGGIAAGSGGAGVTGGATASGGAAGSPGGSGGTDPGAGGAATGGAGTGGAQATCDLPSSFQWKSSQPLITPKPPAGKTFASIKDPTIVSYQGKYHVFATVYETTAGSSGWHSVYLNFTDFSQASAAPQSYMPTWATGSTVAPQVFFFRPHNKWYLIYQWGARYSTNDDINNPNGWTAPKRLLNGEPNGALDFWTICDDANCHLFFSADDGKLYRSKVSVANFPAFNGYDIVMSDPNPGRLFEASNVYKVEGTNKYLLMVEAYGPRYFRSWTSTSLDGPWTPLADTQSKPFAGAANVTFDGADWSDDVSHGEMIRAGYDETLTINACHLQFLYQGVDPNSGVRDYGLLPYRLGLLTQTN